MKVSFALIPLLMLGCAFAPGQPFATFEVQLGVTIDQPADRLLDNGYYKTLSTHDVRLDSVKLSGVSLSLLSSQSTSSSSFDPANPPPGYSLCHSGHCHADDGSLVDYEDIEIELAAGTGGGLTAIALYEMDELDSSDSSANAAICVDECLGQFGSLTQIILEAESISISGSAREAETETAFSLVLGVEGEVMRYALSVAMDRFSDPEISLGLAAIFSVKLFDTLDWMEIFDGGELDPGIQQGLLQWIAENAPQPVVVSRGG